MSHTSKSAPRKLGATLRAIEGLKLRVTTDKTWAEIADALGYADKGHAYQQCMALYDKNVSECVDEIRQIEWARLERMMAALSDKITAGDVQAIDVARKVSESIRKLAGGNLPERAPVDAKGDAVPVLNLTVTRGAEPQST